MEPLAAHAARLGREGELVVSGQPGKEPCRGVAETFAGVAPPAGCAAKGVGASQRSLAPFGAPAQFTSNLFPQLSREHLLPIPAPLVRKAHPSEMKQFMDQNALKFTAPRQDRDVEQNQTVWNGSSGQMRPQ